MRPRKAYPGKRIRRMADEQEPPGRTPLHNRPVQTIPEAQAQRRSTGRRVWFSVGDEVQPAFGSNDQNNSSRQDLSLLDQPLPDQEVIQSRGTGMLSRLGIAEAPASTVMPRSSALQYLLPQNFSPRSQTNSSGMNLTTRVLTVLSTLAIMVLLPIFLPRNPATPANARHVPLAPLFSALESWSGWAQMVKRQSEVAIIGGPEARAEAEGVMKQVYVNISHQVKLRTELDQACEPLWIKLTVARKSRDLNRWQYTVSHFYNLTTSLRITMNEFSRGLKASSERLDDLSKSVELSAGYYHETMKGHRRHKNADEYETTHKQYQAYKTAGSFIEQCRKMVANGESHLRVRGEREQHFYASLSASGTLLEWDVDRTSDGRWVDPHIRLVDEAKRLAETELPLWLNGDDNSPEGA